MQNGPPARHVLKAAAASALRFAFAHAADGGDAAAGYMARQRGAIGGGMFGDDNPLDDIMRMVGRR